MAYVKVTKSDTFETWRQKTNEVGANFGDYPLLYKNATVDFTGITGQPPAGYGGSTVAVFSIAATAGVYSITAITTAGLGYNVNDVITVYGSDLGGIMSTHDMTITVDSIDIDSGIATASVASGIGASNLVSESNQSRDELGSATLDLTTTAPDIKAAINELDLRQGNAVLTTTASDLSDAINEHDAELGLITATALNTTASTVSTAINEVSTNVKDAQVEIGGDMLTDYQGNIDSSGTDSIIGTLNNLYTKQGTATLSTTASDLSLAINELDTKQGAAALTTTATTISGAINQHDTELGTITAAAMGTTASTVSTAIKEHEDQIGNEDITGIDTDSDTITGALNQLHGEVGSLSLNTTATNLTAALNELEADLFNAQGATKRTLTDLKTSDNTSIVDAINELHNELYVSGATFTGLSAVNFKAAVDELRVELGDHSSLNTAATVSVVAAINELEAELFNVEGANKRTLASLNTGDKTSIVDAINEVHDEIGNTSISTITTDDENTVSGALVQLHGEVGDATLATMGTTVATNLTTAMKEVGDVARGAATDIGGHMNEDYDGNDPATVGGVRGTAKVIDALNSLYTASSLATLDGEYVKRDGTNPIDADKFLSVSNKGLTATTGNELVLNTTSTDANQVATDTARIRIRPSDGNVGVGKAPSTYKLDVNGTVKSSGFTEGTTTLANKYVAKSSANTLSAANTFTGNVSLTPDAAKTITIGGSIVTNTSATPANNFTFLEFLQDNVASMFDSSGDLTKTYDDTNGKISFAVDDDSHNHTASNIDSFAETVRDTVGDMLTGNTETRIAVTHNDSTNKLNFTVDADIVTTLSHNTASQTLSYVDEAGVTTNISLGDYIDDSNLARLVSGTLDGSTGIATFKRDDDTTFTIDMSALLDDSNWARITSAAFNNSNGIITFTRNDASTFNVDIDGRYSLDTHVHSINDLTDATTEGANNLGIGDGVLNSVTSTLATHNTGVGLWALPALTNSKHNTALGYAALGEVSTTSSNTGVGSQAVRYNTGSGNTGVGYRVLYGVSGSSGGGNTGVGSTALEDITSGYSNIGIGSWAGRYISTGYNNTVIGSLSGTTTMSDTVLIGAGTTERVKVNTTGLYINGTLAALTDTVYSHPNLNHIPTGGVAGNILRYAAAGTAAWDTMSVNSLTYGIHAAGSLGIGSGALDADDGGNNNNNTAFGDNALTSTTGGSNNTAIGNGSMVFNVTGLNNTSVGSGSMRWTTASNNTAIGWNSLNLNSTGSKNIGLGYGAGDAIKTGSNNTVIGDLAGSTAMASTVLIGAGATERIKVTSTGLYINSTLAALTDTTYSTATSSTLGLVKIGYTASAKNYPVALSSEKMYVNVPWSDTTYSIGDGGLTTKDFTADLKLKLDGIAANATADQLLVAEASGIKYNAISYQPRTSATNNSTALRDSAGNLSANIFNGVATSARYADLAEKYLADGEYGVGTVMSVGGLAEVTASTIQNQHSVLGVVSENPAFMMNKDLEGGTYVALKGRVQVRVQGMIEKGDRLSASSIPGVAITNNNPNEWTFAIALESGSDTIEAVIL